MQQFEFVENNIDFPLCHMSDGKWDLGIVPVLYGMRVAANPVGDNFYKVNYCLGNNISLLCAAFISVLTILEKSPYPDRDFPEWQARPIFQDNCFVNLICKAGNYGITDLIKPDELQKLVEKDYRLYPKFIYSE